MFDSTEKHSYDPVPACTVEAVHRRDHRHADEETCTPHQIEVVHLGRRAIVVCHDCRRDSGFLPQRDAEQVASAHRCETAGDGDSPVSSGVA